MPAITLQQFNNASDGVCHEMSYNRSNLSPAEISSLASFIQRTLIIEDEMFAELAFAEKDDLSYLDAEQQMKEKYGEDAGFIVLRIHLLNLLAEGFTDQDTAIYGVSACQKDFNSIALKLVADIQAFHPDSCSAQIEGLSGDAHGAFIAHLETLGEEYTDFASSLKTGANNNVGVYAGTDAFWQPLPRTRKESDLSSQTNESPGTSPEGPSVIARS